MQARNDPLHPFGTRLADYASTRVIVPLAVLVGVSLLFSVFAIYRSVHLQQTLQREAEARAVTQGVRTIARALTDEVRDYAWWDDAVHSWSLEPDADWADANVGRYIYHSFGYDLSLVLDGTAGASSVRSRAPATPTQRRDRLGPELPLLIAELDGHDRATPSPCSTVWTGSTPRPLRDRARGRLAADRGGWRPPSLVFAKRLEEEFLADLGADFGLTGLHFQRRRRRIHAASGGTSEPRRRGCGLYPMDPSRPRSGPAVSDVAGAARDDPVLRHRGIADPRPRRRLSRDP